MPTLALALLSALDPPPPPSWDVHPRQVEGDIRVAPLIGLAPPAQVQATGLLDEPLPRAELALRQQRAAQLDALPEAVHDAVPGALYAALPEGWQGHFRDTALTPAARRALERAFRGEGDATQAMAEAARESGGDATLFVWVWSADGLPLTSTTPVGELVMAEGVPVVVDRRAEPFAVELHLGLALVAADGELLFRSEDSLRGLLTPEVGVQDLALGVARELVGGIAPLWLGEPPDVALAEGEL